MQACGGKDSEHRPSADRPGGRDRGPRGLEWTWTPTDRCRCTPACAGATSHAPAPCSPWRCSSSPGRTCARPSPRSHPPARSPWSRPRPHHPSHPRRPSHPPSPLHHPRPQPSQPNARARAQPHSADAPARERRPPTPRPGRADAVAAHADPHPSRPSRANVIAAHADPHHQRPRRGPRGRHQRNAVAQPRFRSPPKPIEAEPHPSSSPNSGEEGASGKGAERKSAEGPVRPPSRSRPGQQTTARPSRRSSP